MRILVKTEIQSLSQGNVRRSKIILSLSFVTAKIIRGITQGLHRLFYIVHSSCNVGMTIFLRSHQVNFLRSRGPVANNDINADPWRLRLCKRSQQQ